MASWLGLYLHIPFCRARCGYCDFVTFTGQEHQIDGFIEALTQEIAQAQRQFPDPPIKTIFFGGGTPSLLERSHLERIFQALKTGWNLENVSEITLEANPESVSAEKLDAWKSAGPT